MALPPSAAERGRKTRTTTLPPCITTGALGRHVTTDDNVSYDGGRYHGDPDAFPARLAKLIGKLSVRAFARKAGVSDTFLRQCLAGRTEPTRTKLLAIARAGKTSVEWLATGRGTMHGTDGVRSGNPGPALDGELLERVIEVTEDVLREEACTLTPGQKAALIVAAYDLHGDEGEPGPIARETILRLIDSATA